MPDELEREVSMNCETRTNCLLRAPGVERTDGIRSFTLFSETFSDLETRLLETTGVSRSHVRRCPRPLERGNRASKKGLEFEDSDSCDEELQGSKIVTWILGKRVCE